MDVTIPYVLEVSLLGMCVVFAVLVFLMGIIYLMSAVVKAGMARSSRAAALFDVASQAINELPAEVEAEKQEQIPDTNEMVIKPSARPARKPKKFKVTVNGKTYDVVDGQAEEDS